MTQTQPEVGRAQPQLDLLAEIRKQVPLPRDVTPDRALSAVTCALDQHVTGGESRHLFESLPSGVQPLLAPCLIHRGEPATRFGYDGLVRRVADHVGISREEAERMIPGVMAALSSRLPRVGVEHVASQLPEELRRLWLGPKETAARVGPSELIEEVASQLPAGMDAQRAIAVVMCTLSARLPLGEARHLIESLPEDVRDVLEPCLQNRRETPDLLMDRAMFFAHVAASLQTGNVEPVIRAVFHAVQHFLPHDVVHHVHTQLPRDLQRLWANP